MAVDDVLLQKFMRNDTTIYSYLSSTETDSNARRKSVKYEGSNDEDDTFTSTNGKL